MPATGNTGAVVLVTKVGLRSDLEVTPLPRPSALESQSSESASTAPSPIRRVAVYATTEESRAGELLWALTTVVSAQRVRLP